MVHCTVLLLSFFLLANALPVPIKRQQAPTGKLVVAHHIVGNTFPYVLQDWIEDIQLALQSGIDGFALNIGKDDFEQARVSDAFQAAQQVGNFKLFLSLDMSSLPCATEADGQSLRNIVLAHANDSSHLQVNSLPLVSTFAGESCTFGQDSVPNGWKNQFTQHPDLQGKITFVPSFFIDPATFGNFQGVMDGDYNFNSGWPIQVTTAFAQSLGSNESLSTPGNPTLAPFIGSTDTDNQHLSALSALSLQNPVYMAAVSPWFFTHFPPDTFGGKNFMFLADQHLYAKRWEALIALRDQISVVEINTFNDFGESHYIGKIHGDQAGSQSWTDNMDHTGWLKLTQYYATAFKTGQFPTLEDDTIVMWSRTHPATAQSPDPVPPPANFELAEDAVWVVVLAKAPGTVTLTTSTSQTFQVEAGVSKLFIPIAAGDNITATLTRDGTQVLQLSPEGFVFNGTPPNFNFNALVVSATA